MDSGTEGAMKKRHKEIVDEASEILVEMFGDNLYVRDTLKTIDVFLRNQKR